MGQIVPIIAAPVGMVESVLQIMEYAYVTRDLLESNVNNVSIEI